MKLDCPYCRKHVKVPDEIIAREIAVITTDRGQVYLVALVATVGFAVLLSLVLGIVMGKYHQEQLRQRITQAAAREKELLREQRLVQAQIEKSRRESYFQEEKVDSQLDLIQDRLDDLKRQREELKGHRDFQGRSLEPNDNAFSGNSGQSSGNTLSKSTEPIQTPLGTIDNVLVLFGEELRLGSHKVKKNHVFVDVIVVARKKYALTEVTNWILVDNNKKRYQLLAIKTKYGTFFGVGNIAAVGSKESPGTNEFVFEVPIGVNTLDLYIGDKNLGEVITEPVRLSKR